VEAKILTNFDKFQLTCEEKREEKKQIDYLDLLVNCEMMRNGLILVNFWMKPYRLAFKILGSLIPFFKPK
jgi:hypothetical protein